MFRATLIAASLVATPAFAQSGQTMTRNDPRLDLDQGWPAGTIREQLAFDPTLIPFGKGAIFVPAMTNPLDEPPVTVYRAGKQIREAKTGERIVLNPGRYTVFVGSGSEDQRLSFEAEVREMNTTILPVTWSGLSVHVVNASFNSLRDSYELIRMDDRQYLGVGFGANEQAGEPIATWIVPPGLYKIVSVGETYRARTDFATVRLLPGKHTHFLWVLDEETRNFEGGGEVSALSAQNLFFQESDGFGWNAVVGGDASLNSRNNVVGQQDGVTYNLRAFVDARINAEIFGGPFINSLDIEEGVTQPSDNDRIIQTQDRAELDSLYVYPLYPWIGPYVSLGASTNLFYSREFFDQSENVRKFGIDGQQIVFQREDVLSTRLRPPLGLSNLRQGLGVNVRPLKTLAAEGIVRLGLGARQVLTRNLFVRTDRSDGFVNFVQVPSSDQTGVEAIVIARARIARYVFASVEFDSLLPFDRDLPAIVNIEGTVNVKLTEYLSVNYILRYLRNRNISPEDQLEQDVLLRFSLAVP